MNKTCVFKACKGNEWWYVYRYTYAKPKEGFYYRVYCGRRWYDKMTWIKFEWALGQLMEGCFGLTSAHFGVPEL